jgi:transposase-like protein
MYAKGMSTSDIEEHIRDIYGLGVSDSTVSRIIDKILPEAKEMAAENAGKRLCLC